jgi:hypothetical protein
MRPTARLRGATAGSRPPSPSLRRRLHRVCRASALTVLVLTAYSAAATATSISLNPAPPQPIQPTSATITPSLSPDRLRARAALTITIHYAGGEFGVPSPVRRSVLALPAGMSLDVPSLRGCSAGRLRAHGPSGCPARSQLGDGHALVETHTGAQTTTENVTLQAFLGSPDNLEPTFDILAQGYTPLDERLVFGGSVRSDRAPYGEELVMSIPPVPSLPLEPDASILTFSLTVGSSTGHRAGDQNAVRVPAKCPPGGFPLDGEFTYADGSVASVPARIPCPS